MQSTGNIKHKISNISESYKKYNNEHKGLPFFKKKSY